MLLDVLRQIQENPIRARAAAVALVFLRRAGNLLTLPDIALA